MRTMSDAVKYEFRRHPSYKGALTVVIVLMWRGRLLFYLNELIPL